MFSVCVCVCVCVCELEALSSVKLTRVLGSISFGVCVCVGGVNNMAAFSEFCKHLDACC